MSGQKAIEAIRKLMAIANGALLLGDPTLAACALRGAERVANEHGLSLLVVLEHEHTAPRAPRKDSN